MISDFLTDDHRHCDALFAHTEAVAGDGDGAATDAAFAQFRGALEHHLEMEETVLFPAFEERTGMQGGPTAVMRMEHEQMRALLARLHAALAADALDDFLGFLETLNILIQQHNMKEEHMLYPMSERAFGAEAPSLLERMQQV